MLRRDSGELKIEIAEICCLVRAKDGNFLDHLVRERYSGFLSDKDPALTVNIEIQEESAASLYDGRGPLIEHFAEGSSIVFRSFDDDIKGQLNVATGQASGTVCRALNRFDAFLRILYSFWLVRTGGFLLHAAGVSDGKGAYVFFGVSGSGKTSVARLSADRSILSDELVAIRKQNSSYQIHATPFWGEFAKGGENCSARLKKIFLLKKDNDNYVTELGRPEALAALLPCVLFFGENTGLADNLFDACCEMIESIPFFELHFLPDGSFWRCLTSTTGGRKNVKS